ncbi:MAG: AAA family ATPase, partial [Thermodesulfobacteriota bacterium]|nr:AAA family ATPase [Thermodesulfobacteriota bacterium]
FFTRYSINLFVDNEKTNGAPMVVCDHPTTSNLLGCVEREAELGALFTDFTLIKAGALHRANHGFLILRMEDLSGNPEAWEGLLRALGAGRSKIEDPDGDHDQTRIKTIEPEPIPLHLKVVLIGTDLTYEHLLNDDRFQKLFKLKAHLQDTVLRSSATIKDYLHSLARIIRKTGLLPLDKTALAGMVDFSSRVAEDRKKLSLRLPLARDLMVEASALARAANQERVDKAVLDTAIRNREFRANLYEEEFMDDYDRELIKVATSGKAVGRANGLSVTLFGDYEFGLPHQIACTVGVGHGGILDLEREAELGGPIHTKGMMILKSYLLGLFAQDKPLVLTGSLCFEQSYAHVEGDSASGAELAALLSSLAEAPINLSLAFTGAVSQSGTILSVSAVTRKVEGFFEVCRRRGLTGSQGVIIPADNVAHMMLKKDVIRAIEEGKFHIYPVKTIEQAMEVLTGMPTGRHLKNGKFSKGSLYRLVDERLAKLASLADYTPKSGRKR